MSEGFDKSIDKLFDNHRIVFWFDEKSTMEADFNQYLLSHPDIKSVKVKNNEIQIKYEVLIKFPQDKFLIYKQGAKCPDEENWLLDLELSSGQFSADKAEFWRMELGITDPGLTNVIRSHIRFFNRERVSELKKKLENLSQSLNSVSFERLLIQLICSSTSFEYVLFHLLKEKVNNSTNQMDQIKKYDLEGILWDWFKEVTGYSSQNPSLEDFLIVWFRNCSRIGLDLGNIATGGRIKNAIPLLSSWRDNENFSADYKQLSKEISDQEDLKGVLGRYELKHLIDEDCFELFDYTIVYILLGRVIEKTISPQELSDIVQKRKDMYWAKHDDKILHFYLALDYAVKFSSELSGSNFEMKDASEGIQKYAQVWYKIDQLYRGFITNVHRLSSFAPTLTTLYNRINQQYQTYLRDQSGKFQEKLLTLDSWFFQGINPQSQFFVRKVSVPFLDNHKKVAVIISDALRYEVAEEFKNRLAQDWTVETSIEPMYGVIPSFTQLGMASLLPHDNKLGLRPSGGSLLATINGKTVHPGDRESFLKVKVPRAKVFLYKDIVKSSATDIRNIFKEHDLFFIYHDKLDRTGEQSDKQESVFAAVDDCYTQILGLIRKLNSGNVNNIIVTADHGFLYRDYDLTDQDFIEDKPSDPQAYIDRRFVIGKALDDNKKFQKFTAAQLGLEGDFEVQIPKGVTLLRKRGNEGRFVHGGASLQEIVIPLLAVRYIKLKDKRATPVEVAAWIAGKITNSHPVVHLKQMKPVSEEFLPVELNVGFYLDDQAKEPVSESYSASFEGETLEEKSFQFSLKTGALKRNQTFYLVLKSKIRGTGQERIYLVNPVKYEVQIEVDDF